MTDLLLLALGASLVNNFVLSSFLGSAAVRRRRAAASRPPPRMALATLFVLTIASGLSFAAWHCSARAVRAWATCVRWCFILLIARVGAARRRLVGSTSPLLHDRCSASSCR